MNCNVKFLLIIFLLLQVHCNHDKASESPFQNNWDTVNSDFYSKDSIHYGEATFYGIAGIGGNCALPSPSPWDTLAGAMNHVDYRNSEICGSCVMVRGVSDSVLIRINDQCPECKEGDIDLTPNAFAKIGPMVLGRMPISWHFVPCPDSGNVSLYFYQGSTCYYTAIQVRNHRNPVRTMDFYSDSLGWINMIRKPSNRFEAVTSSNASPLIIRVRDVFGNEITDSSARLMNGDSFSCVLSKQFPFP